MKITRNVVFDLLPGYFTGDISDDSRALVEAWFTAHGDNRQLAAEVLATTGGTGGSAAGPAAAEAAAERGRFERLRARVTLQQAAFFWLAGATLAIVLGLVVTSGAVTITNPGLIIGLVFGLLAAVSWSVSFRPDAARWAEVLLGWSSPGRG